MTTRDERWKIKGIGVVPNTTTDQFPQRAEFYGGFAIASLLKAFYIWGNYRPLRLITWIDNDIVVTSNEQKTKQIGLKHFLVDDYDVWDMTRITLHETGCNISWKWVKGHQDNDTAYEDLPFEAQLNVQVNELAETAHKKLSIPPTYSTLDTPLTVYINKEVASHSNLRWSIQNVAHSDDLLQYMAQKYDWTNDILQSIDWDLFSYCYSKHQIHKMTNIIKYIHGWQFTKGKEHQQNPKSSPTWPVGCGEQETQLHYLTCTEPKWLLQVHEETAKLKRKLIQMNTAPVIISTLMYSMSHEYSTLQHQWPKAFSLHEKVAYMAANEQQRIGWKNMLQGRLSKKWSITQHYYLKDLYKSLPIPPGTYKKWKKSFLPTLIKFGINLWELRNGYVHGTNPQEAAHIRRKRLNKEIIKKYSMGSKSVSPAQRRLFQKPLALRLHDSNHSKNNWITSVSIAQQARKHQLETLYHSYPWLTCFDGFSIKPLSSPSPRS